MSPLVWLVIPAVATLLAIAWASWSTRTRGPEETHDSVAAYERFRAALSASTSASTAASTSASTSASTTGTSAPTGRDAADRR